MHKELGSTRAVLNHRDFGTSPGPNRPLGWKLHGPGGESVFAAPYFSCSSQERCSSYVFSDFFYDGLISPT